MSETTEGVTLENNHLSIFDDPSFASLKYLLEEVSTNSGNKLHPKGKIYHTHVEKAYEIMRMGERGSNMVSQDDIKIASEIIRWYSAQRISQKNHSEYRTNTKVEYGYDTERSEWQQRIVDIESGEPVRSF